jgi:hypothetical protein
MRVEGPTSVIFGQIKYNMVSPTIPVRNALSRTNVIVHLPLDQEAAEPLVEVGPATDVVPLGKGGFVIVKAVELVELCTSVGVADTLWLESVIPGSNELKFAGGSVDYITPHQPLHYSFPSSRLEEE